VGAGEIFEKVVIGWPRTGGKSTPAEEQMMISRTKEYTDFAIYDDIQPTREQLYKIGKGKAADMRLAFERSHGNNGSPF